MPPAPASSPIPHTSSLPTRRAARKAEEGPRREKGTGGLQLEKTGMWTVRCRVNGKRISKSTGTKDRAEAEEFARKFLAPYVKDDAARTYANIQAAVATERQLAEIREDEAPQMTWDDAWKEYEASPMRRDLAKTTLDGKQQVIRTFVDWLKKAYPEVIELRHLRRNQVEAYLNYLRLEHSANTYNQRLCVLREVYRTLMKKARAKENPWEGFPLRADDTHTRRELTIEELARLVDLANREGPEWRLLFAIAMYTGLRLGDCARLRWSEVDVVKSIIQRVPEKTKKYRKGRPVTVPIHRTLSDLLIQTPLEKRSGFVLPVIGSHAGEGVNGMSWIHHRIGKIFHNAGIVTSVKIKGRRWKAPEASFHSLRHTFVSLSANAGVPLHIVQAIVGHESTAMTRHYYHENIQALQQAVEAIPNISETGEVTPGEVAQPDARRLGQVRTPAFMAGVQAEPVATLPPPGSPRPALAAPRPAPLPPPQPAVERESTAREQPLEGRSAERNAVRREDKLADVEAANAEARTLGGWGFSGEDGQPSRQGMAHLPNMDKRYRTDWTSRCVKRWCRRNHMALLEGTTKLIGNGGYRFLVEVWEKGVPMLPDDALDAMEVFIKAKA